MTGSPTATVPPRVTGAVSGAIVCGAVGIGLSGTWGLLGAPIGGALGFAAGALVGAAGGAAGGRRGRTHDRIDPFTIDEPWRRQVQQALSARRRFREAAESVAAGPTRDRLASFGLHVDDLVDDVWTAAKAGHAAAKGARRLDIVALRRDLERATQRHDDIAAIATQIETRERLDASIDAAQSRLRGVVARLGEIVSRAVEISVGSPGGDAVSALEADAAATTDELTALRDALRELPNDSTGPT